METISPLDIKRTAKSVLHYLHLDLTKNLKYDRLTKQIMKKNLRKDSNCIDIGCHVGEMLDNILEISPEGRHLAFEPIPHLYGDLLKKYHDKASIYPYALSKQRGSSTFQVVKNALAFSGIRKRDYDVKIPDIEEIQVELYPLDEIIDEKEEIHFIKIDVEGGEFDVLKGAVKLLKRTRPLVVFESGTGASEYYGTKPRDLYVFLTEIVGLQISSLADFLTDCSPLTIEEYESHYTNNTEYYFIAHP